MAVTEALPLERRQPARGDIPVWQAPLVPIALALTAGIVLDRYTQPRITLSLALAAASLLAWLVHRSERSHIAYLGLVIAALGSAYHHVCRYHVALDDIGRVADEDPVPCRLRGRVESSPHTELPEEDNALRSMPPRTVTRFLLQVFAYDDMQGAWRRASGALDVYLNGSRADLALGDTVEALGRLRVPAGAANPGALDPGGRQRDRGISATFTILDPQQIDILEHGWARSLSGWLAALQGRGERLLAAALPEKQQAIGQALLLGEETSMTRAEWDLYQRTGVIHVLAISGQHLSVLGWFLWLTARACGLRRRWAAPVVALILVGYALMAGGRPPVMRAALMVFAWCLAIVMRRPVQVTNLYALAWIGVALWQPTDVFNTGCQLSFLAVAVLLWGAARWRAAEPDALQPLSDESRPWVRMLRRAFVWLACVYAVNASIWLAVTPLIAARYHLVAPVALVLGPPLALLTSVGLIAGFILLLFGPWGGPLAWPFAVGTQACLALCDTLVQAGAKVPGGYVYLPDLPEWWLWTFYIVLLSTLVVGWQSRAGRSLLACCAAWFGFGVLLIYWPHRPGEFRCTFLAVGHGGCTVLETPGGQVLMYDAGANTGPEVTRRHIAPFLWQRGIRHLDQLIVSHADLDHFNGMRALTERFTVGEVISTPSFAERELQAVRHVLVDLQQRQIPYRSIHTPAALQVDGTELKVLHPPAQGPEGNENARSLVLLVQHRDLRLLLTGDLEGAGLARVLATPPPGHIDVLMAPHHGSEHSDPVRLAAWARPRYVVSCQAKPHGTQSTARSYEQLGAEYFPTWTDGAVTVRIGTDGAWLETFRSRQRRPLGRNSP
jgi:competence protein ComEC